MNKLRDAYPNSTKTLIGSELSRLLWLSIIDERNYKGPSISYSSLESVANFIIIHLS